MKFSFSSIIIAVSAVCGLEVHATFANFQRQVLGKTTAELGANLYQLVILDETPDWSNWKKYAIAPLARPKVISTLTSFVKNQDRSISLEVQLESAHNYIQNEVFAFGDASQEHQQALFDTCRYRAIYSTAITLVAATTYNSNFAYYKLWQMMDAVASDAYKGYEKRRAAAKDSSHRLTQVEIIRTYLEPCVNAIAAIPDIAVFYPQKRLIEQYGPEESVSEEAVHEESVASNIE